MATVIVVEIEVPLSGIGLDAASHIAQVAKAAAANMFGLPPGDVKVKPSVRPAKIKVGAK